MGSRIVFVDVQIDFNVELCFLSLEERLVLVAPD